MTTPKAASDTPLTDAVPQDYQPGDKLTGKEPWLVAGLQGETLWAHRYGDGPNWWWPIIHVGLDVGLITIDVCGKEEVWDLGDCSEVRIGLGEIVKHENFYDQPTLAAQS